MTAALLGGVLYGCGTLQQKGQMSLYMILRWERQTLRCAEV
jgi:hypothetical protein